MGHLLERQLKRHLPDLSEEDKARMSSFLMAIEQAYRDADSDREMLERSLEISSKEMAEKNKELQDEIDVNTQAFASLKEAVNTLEPGKFPADAKQANTKEEMNALSDFLQKVVAEHKNFTINLQMEGIKAQKLASELELFKKAVDGAADFISIYDADYRTVYFNRAFHEKIGYELKEVRGQKITDLWWSGMDKAKYEEFYGSIKDNNLTAAMEYDIKSKLGDKIPVRILATPLADDDGNITHIINIAHDITREHELEMRKNEFVSIASHELRTPMTVIRSFAEVLQDNRFGEMNDKQQHYVERIISNTTRLIDFVSDMLDLSKLEEDRLTFELADVPLYEIVNSQVDGFKEVYEKKEMQLNYDQGDGDEAIFVHADPQRVKQVLSNLLSNAYKYTQERGRVNVSLANGEDDMVTVSVKDSGVGISAEGKKALFTKFSQVDNVLQRQSEGTGLGLVICKELVEKMGGKIWVDSVPGQGSTFSFTLPLAKDNQ